MTSAVPLSVNSVSHSHITNHEKIKRSDFNKPDEKFIFGSATSAYQIEGAATEGGKGFSIWDHFTLDNPDAMVTLSANVLDGSNGTIAANQYNLFKDDVKLMKKAGLDAYRFSISWSRVLPGGKLSAGVNREGIKYYNDLIDTLKAEGIEPCVTIFHWDTPLVLELEYGGFLDKKIVEHFCDYAELCFWEFGDRVKNWITVNEAWSYTTQGYVMGTFPPKRGSASLMEVMSHSGEVLRNRSLTAIYDAIGSAPMETIKEIENLTRSIIPSSLKEMSSKLHIEDFVKNKISDSFKNDCPVAVGIIKDFLISYQSDYKSTGVPSPSLQLGDPGKEPYLVAHNIILCHASTVKLYREKFQKHQGGKIGMTNNITFHVPYEEDNPEDVEAAKRANEFMFYWFVEPIVKGKYPDSMIKNVGKNLPVFTAEERELVKGSFDFLGINYYTTYYTLNLPKYPHAPGHYYLDQENMTTPTKKGKPIGPQCQGWLYHYPLGIYKMLSDVTERFKGVDGQGPVIYITENGANEEHDSKKSVCDARYDSVRVTYHNDHLWYLKKAIDEGVKVKAYFVWSFADTFEWNAGYLSRFGLFYVDFINGNYSRYPKNSALWWTGFTHDVEELKVPEIAKVSSKRVITNGEEDQENDPKKRLKT